MHGFDGWGWGHMWGMGLFWILVIAVAAALIVWLVRAGAAGRGPSATIGAPPRASAEDVLRERYARGEIDAEEYRTRLAELRRP